MQSIRTRSFCVAVMSGLGMLAVWTTETIAGNPFCDPCWTSKLVMPVIVPAVRAEAPIVAVDSSAVPMAAQVIPTGRSLLVLNCPADARVTIDGRVTHSSGKTRQYHLSFDGDVHDCLLEIRLRDNDQKVTYEFSESLHCLHHQRLVRTVIRQQMEPKPDRHPAEEVAKLLAPGTTLKVTNDHKFELLATASDPEQQAATASPMIEQAKPVQPTLLELAIAHQKKVVAQQQAKLDELAGTVEEKTTRFEAAARLRKLAQDAHQVKIAEMNAALNDAAANPAKQLELKQQASAKQVEAKKLELEITRAREIEQQAFEERTAAQDQWNKAQEQVRRAEAALKKTKSGRIEIELP